MSEGKDRLLAQMKDAEGAVYALISGYTKEPYVECDGETYDDKVFVYLSEDAAKARVAELKEEKIPVGVAKILSNHMLWASMRWKSTMMTKWICSRLMNSQSAEKIRRWKRASSGLKIRSFI